MTIENFEWVDRHFRRALELTGSEREAFLRRCRDEDAALEAQLRALLAAAENEGSFATAGAQQGATWQETAADLGDLAPGTLVGRYRVVREIGRGGMATVFLAERDDELFEHQVALKVLHPAALGTETVRRFDLERQILGRLRHPNIAQIHDGGITVDGRPYIAMELVDGRPIDEHCRERCAGIEELLDLALQMIDALKAAHRQLVVHRDLKPSNVLVTAAGHVKLLDFGIAKVLEDDRPQGDHTARFLRLLTPQYASPEQVRGEPVSTATDVYQVGGLLYLLLAGRPPYVLRDGTPQEMERVVCTEVPPPPSQVATAALQGKPDIGIAAAGDSASVVARRRWRARLRGDLDAIVMMALRKEPDRRYGSMEELEEDLRRHLDGRPVKARPDSLGYRTSRWIGRHRLLAASLAFLVAYAGTTTWLGRRWSLERDAARASASQARAVTGFMEDLFREADPYVSGEGTLSALDLVRLAPARVQTELAHEPELQSLVYTLVGRILLNLGDEGEGEAQLRQAIEILERDPTLAATPSISRVGALRSLALLDTRQRREKEALALLDGAEKELQALPSTQQLDERVLILDVRGRALTSMGRYDEAIQAFLEAESLVESQSPIDRKRLLMLRNGRAQALHESGRDREGTIELAQANLEQQRKLVGSDHPTVFHFVRLLAAAYGSLAFELRESDPQESARYLAEVDRLLAEAEGISRRHFGEHQPHLADIQQMRGAVRFSLGDWEGARRAYGEARRLFAQLEGYGDEAANALMYVGLATLKEGDAEESIETFEEVLAEMKEIAGPQHQRTAVAETNLAEAYFEIGRWEPAREHFRSALDIHLDTLGADHWRTSRIRLALADCHLELAEEALDKEGPSAAARDHFDRAQELYDGALEEDDEKRHAAIARMAKALGV